ncbi:MAG: HAD family hydrolase [Cyanobacterium sp.]
MNQILALDFDGVVCDGMAEYFHSSRLTYEQIWQKSLENIEHSKEIFNHLRPTIETGWEMPLIFRAMEMEQDKQLLFDHWSSFVKKIIEQDGIKKENIAKALDNIRQKQINNNLEQWLGLHTFYSQIIETLIKVINEGYKVYIITTKEGKFVRKILESAEIDTDKITVWGKEQKRPKYESLRLIINQEKVSPRDICFIEDRLEALEGVRKQPDLDGVKLFLATWGYNTQAIREKVTGKSGIGLLSLEDFTQGDMEMLFH